ncbi:MAG: type II secretion system protein J [Verrucomicrobiales bacterium]
MPTNSSTRIGNAFTLLEVLGAMAVISVLMGGIFTVLNMAFSTMGEMRQTVTRTSEMRSLEFFLSDLFGNLPTRPLFEIEVVKYGDKYYQQLAIRRAELLRWLSLLEAQPWPDEDDLEEEDGENQTVSSRHLILILAHEPRGEAADGEAVEGDYLYLRTQLRFEEAALERQEPRGGLPLLRGIDSVQWRVLDFDTREWIRDWKFDSGRPMLVELTVRFLNEELERRWVFRVLPRQRVPNPGQEESR